MKGNSAQKPKTKTTMVTPQLGNSSSNAREKAREAFNLGKKFFEQKSKNNKKNDLTEKDLQENIQKAF